MVRRRWLISRATTLVVISAWLFVRFRRLATTTRGVSYGPLSARDEEHDANLRFIYHSNDRHHCVELLRMRRAPFF